MNMKEFIRKVYRYKGFGGTKGSLQLGRVIPKDWDYVKVTVLERGKNYIILKIEKIS